MPQRAQSAKIHYRYNSYNSKTLISAKFASAVKLVVEVHLLDNLVPSLLKPTFSPVLVPP